MMETGARRSSLARVVLTGAGLIALAGGVNRVFSIVTAPILTRLLGPVPYGVVALLGTVTSFASIAALLGVDMSYARFFLAVAPGEANAVERFCWRFTAGTAIAISLAAGALWSAMSGYADLQRSLAVMVTAGILLSVANNMSATRQRLLGAYRRIAGSILAAGVVGAALSILLALFWRKDEWALLVGAAGGTAVGIVVAGLPSFKAFAEPSGLPASRRGEILKLAVAGVVNAPAYWLMNSVDRWCIGAFQGQGPLGVYSFAVNVGITGLMLNSAITMTWFPEMLRVYEASREDSAAEIGRMWARLSAGLMVVWLAVSASGGDLIRLLAAPSFHGGTSYVPWIAGGVFFYGVSAIAGTGHAIRMDLKPVAVVWATGAAVNAVLNILLVRRLGAYGAAVAVCASFAMIAAGVMWSSQSRFRLPVPWGRLAAAGGLSLLSGLVLSPPWTESPFRSLLLKLPAGIAIAALVMWIVAPDWMRRLLSGELFRKPGSGPS
jgi:O-antigen/teichoic acid export membrane protein